MLSRSGVSKGQASVEFLFVFAIGLLIFIMMFALVGDQISMAGTQKEYIDADNALARMAQAVRDVYAQGEGSSRVVSFDLPETYEPDGSGIDNNTIFVQIRDDVRSVSFPFRVTGTLPEDNSGQSIRITSRGGSVFIGEPIFAPDRRAISSIIPEGESNTFTIYVNNLIGSQIQVQISKSWNHDGAMNLDISDSTLTIEPYGNASFTATLTASSSKGGYYGTIDLSTTLPVSDAQQVTVYGETP